MVPNRNVSAPTSFSLYLSAMLKIAFENVRADWFSISQFKSKTSTMKCLVRETLYADDSALVAQLAEDMQLLIDHFARTVSQFSLKINIKKTECLYQPVKILYP